MREIYLYELLHLLWPLQKGRTFSCEKTSDIKVISCGNYDEPSDCYTNANIVVGGESKSGTVALGHHTDDTAGETILHVIPHEMRFSTMDSSAPVLAIYIDPVLLDRYAMLRRGFAERECSSELTSMEGFERINLYSRLIVDRLNRKSDEVLDFFAKSGGDWQETMHIMLMRSMDISNNKENLTELAQRVPYSVISREKGNLHNIETLLLGTSGLLLGMERDEYIDRLLSDFSYLSRKYQIEAMSPDVWNHGKGYGSYSPSLRIAQLAGLLCDKTFDLHNIVNSNTVEDIQFIFKGEASQYWATFHTSLQYSSIRSKKISPIKANLIGINFVVPLMFAFGRCGENEIYMDKAIDLLDKINCESNSLVNKWREKGVVLESAFDSQAVIQLTKEYCMAGKCWQCSIAKTIVKRMCKD